MALEMTASFSHYNIKHEGIGPQVMATSRRLLTNDTKDFLCTTICGEFDVSLLLHTEKLLRADPFACFQQLRINPRW